MVLVVPQAHVLHVCRQPDNMLAPPVQSVPGLRQRDQGLIGSRPLGVALSSAPAPRFPRPAMRGHPGVRVGRRDGRELLHQSRSRK